MIDCRSLLAKASTKELDDLPDDLLSKIAMAVDSEKRCALSMSGHSVLH